MKKATYLDASLHHIKQIIVFDYVTKVEWTTCCKLFMCKLIESLKKNASQKIKLIKVKAQFDD
jgi:Fic family protein